MFRTPHTKVDYTLTRTDSGKAEKNANLQEDLQVLCYDPFRSQVFHPQAWKLRSFCSGKGVKATGLRVNATGSSV